jgi:ribosomal protein L29
MKNLKAKDLRSKSDDDLEAMLAKEQQALYDMRRKAGFRDLKDTTSLKVQRHNIARLHTVIAEKQRGSN